MCFVDLEGAYDTIPGKLLEWAMRKKGIAEVLVSSMMSLYEGTMIRIIVDSEFSEVFEVKCTKDLCCHFFAVVLNIVTELARDRVLSELMI